MRAVRLLEEMGYRHVSHYGGGIRDWRRANQRFDTSRERSVKPEERSPPARMESDAPANPS